MSITLELPGSPGWHSLQTYVAKYKVAKIGDIAEGELSFEVRWNQRLMKNFQTMRVNWMGACAGYLGVAWRRIRQYVGCYPWYCWRRSSVNRDSWRDGYLQSASQRNNWVSNRKLGTNRLRIYSGVLDLRGILRVLQLLPRCPENGGRFVKYSLSAGVSTAFKLVLIR